MTLPLTTADLPSDAIQIRTYCELDCYLSKFAAQELDLLLLLGRPGTGKTEGVKRNLGLSFTKEASSSTDISDSILYVEGHARPYGLYRQLWRFRGSPVVLDDLDRLYADADCIRLLKPLCSGLATKRINWLTYATVNSGDIPSAFTTTSNVMLIANEWRSLNANVRALEDRAIIVCFDPPNAEVHAKVAEWFNDAEVYDFIAAHLPRIPVISMRHYEKGRRLRRAGLKDWRRSLLQMILPDHALAFVAALQRDPKLSSDKQRIAKFIDVTGRSRPTYYRLKKRLGRPLER